MRSIAIRLPELLQLTSRYSVFCSEGLQWSGNTIGRWHSTRIQQMYPVPSNSWQGVINAASFLQSCGRFNQRSAEWNGSAGTSLPSHAAGLPAVRIVCQLGSNPRCFSSKSDDANPKAVDDPGEAGLHVSQGGDKSPAPSTAPAATPDGIDFPDSFPESFAVFSKEPMESVEAMDHELADLPIMQGLGVMAPPKPELVATYLSSARSCTCRNLAS